MRILVVDCGLVSPGLMQALEKIAYVSRVRTVDHATHDRAETGFRFADKGVELGTKRKRLPNGALLCEEVPIARVGSMAYGPGETPVTTGPRGFVTIHRTADDLFSPETIAGLHGLALVNEHPRDDVFVHNWRDHSCGIVLNPRRGTGDNSDLLMADLLVTDENAIRAIESGKREVSLGYDADYTEIEPGVGRQSRIVGNHVALVHRGRCGTRCAIGDHSSCKTPTHDSGKTPMEKSIWQRILAAIGAGNTAEAQTLVADAERMAGEAKPTEVHIHAGATRDSDADQPAWFKAHVEANNKRFDEIEQALTEIGTARTHDAERQATQDAAREAANQAEQAQLATNLAREAPAGKGELAAKARDSEFLADSFQEAVALGEILVPGIQIPTFDRAAAPKATFDAICSFRRKALDQAYAAGSETKLYIDTMMGGKEFKPADMTCEGVRTLFQATGNWKRTLNMMTPKTTKDAGGKAVVKVPKTPAELNAYHREKFAKKPSTTNADA